MAWTEDQKRAIDARGANLLVAAAAGSGKTSVMVARVLALVDEGANIDDMLVVTFTRAASADMRDKLRARFSERAAAGDARAREQLERLESASISTLDSFCAELLRANFGAAGVDPLFRVLDDAENAQMIDRALGEALESAYQAGGEDMDALDFARGPDKVRALALAMYQFLEQRPEPEEWMRYALSLMDGDGALWADTLARAAKARVAEAAALNEYGAARAEAPMGPLQYAEAMREDGRVFEAMRELSYEPLSSALLEFKQVSPRRARIGKEEKERALYEEVTDIRKRVKRAIDAALRLLSLNLSASMRDVRQNRGAVLKLYEIARDLTARLREARSQKSALTFSDLEHLALLALGDPRVAARVRERYAYVFVDEYQDTSDVQEAILSRVAGEKNRFMVGDVKQSVYRFREAEPRLFLEKYAQFKSGGEGRLIVLKQNFRSRAAILEFVNLLFARVMRGGDSEIVYDDDARLYPGASFEGEDPPVEIHIVDKGAASEESEDADDDEAALTDAEREGVLIARRIRALMKEDAGLKYSDICVITRVRVNALSYLASALSSEGIPCYADASERYFDALEVMEVVSALRLVVNRRRDIDLIGVLRSPMFSLSSSELAAIRAGANADTFYDALLAARETPKIARFFALLDDWRALSRAMPIPRLIRRVLSDTGFYASVGALLGGEQRQANLDALCARASAYEAGPGGSLPEFLEYASGMRARGDGDSAHVLGENDDVVRLMTAHKSKGLQFPVVFAALLGRKYRAARAEDTLIAHRSLGAALMRVDETLQTRRDTVARRAIVAQNAMEDRAEELRVLYVMLTRPQSRLILAGSVKNIEQARVKWKIAEGFPDLFDCNLDIAAAAARNCPGAEALGGEAKPGMPRVNAYIHAGGGFSLPGEAEDDGGEAKEALLDRAMAGEGYDEDMARAIFWAYPEARRVHAPVKLTASSLAREVVGAEYAPDIVPRPRFMMDVGMTPAERGTAAHAALRALDLAALAGQDMRGTEEAILRQMLAMKADGRLSEAQFGAVRAGDLARFMLSPVGQRLRASPTVKREWRFNLLMPASRAVPGAPEDAEVAVQGSIDCCFLENGQWVLLDYKTDREGDMEEIAERYAPQLRLYAEALSQITRLPVKESLVCRLAHADAVRVEDLEKTN